MQDKQTFLSVALNVLEESDIPLSINEIWKRAEAKGLDKKLIKSGKTPIASLGSRLYVDVKNKDSKFVIATRKPTTFWLKSHLKGLDESKIQDRITRNQDDELKNSKFKERDLHHLLVKYLRESEEFQLYSKTIFHEKSKKSSSGQDRWNYPDIVGIRFPFSDNYNEQTLALLDAIGQSNYKIYSFELKIALNFSNLKECYFQAVSNSSWANEGYLVVFEEIDNEVLIELKRLNASFGIGVIQLDREVAESKILLPSQVRELDANTLDMLVEKNSDFKVFVDSIVADINVNEKDRIVEDKYDKVLRDNELEKYLKDKNIK